MSDFPCPPVLMLGFNRPDLTEKSFRSIRIARPPALFIAVDGPRPNIAGETQLVQQVRSITEKVDWQCDVQTRFHDTNLGCRLAVSSAIEWFFKNVDSGIILEDDCVADPSFFPMCGELLRRYEDDERIWSITGCNLQNRLRGDASYYFSRFHGVWGWATWKRAWKNYRFDKKVLRDYRASDDLPSWIGTEGANTWLEHFESTLDGRTDSWAYTWILNCWAAGALSIVANQKLVVNIGFDPRATHTFRDDFGLSQVELQRVEFPLRHPPNVAQDQVADDYMAHHVLKMPRDTSWTKRQTKRAVLALKHAIKVLLTAVARKGNIHVPTVTDHSDVQALITRLHPIETGFPLIRIGPDGDGGYLVPDDLSGITTCFSPGVNEESGFELDCARRGMNVHMLDGSVDGPAETHENFTFQKCMLGATSFGGNKTLPDWIAETSVKPDEDLLLQMDIEGSEYESLLATPEHLLNRFRVIIVEMHLLDELWSSSFFRLASVAFDKILKTHVCVHIHPNNATPLYCYRGTEIPPVAEFTFLRRDRVIEPKYATTFPHPLDSDNSDNATIALPSDWYSRRGQ